MAVLETAQAQELINYAKEIGREELPTLVSNSIAEIRKTFANAITTDIDRPLGEQITALVKACEENGIEFVVDKADLFCYNEFETLRITHEYTDNEGNSGEILVDVFITTEFHNQEGEETEENQFLICPDYADVVISLNDTNKGDIVFQDIVGNQLAKLLKGDDVRLQINYNTVMESGKTFVYDGCHKLYVITSEEERQHAKELGYIVDGSTAEDETEHPISELEEYYLKSCPLRFIETFGIGTNESMITILPQCVDCPMFIYY